jgi:hypothetical protein
MPPLLKAPRPAPPGGGAPGARASVRMFTTFAVLIVAGTYVAAQIDFLRRHRPGIAPIQYWWPQITHIWMPGLGTALLCAAIAFLLHKRRRAK